MIASLLSSLFVLPALLGVVFGRPTPDAMPMNNSVSGVAGQSARRLGRPAADVAAPWHGIRGPAPAGRARRTPALDSAPVAGAGSSGVARRRHRRGWRRSQGA